MPAPRTCRSCGADLAPDIRWCTRCYAPVSEFAARERLHDGYVGVPSHERDTGGHWSRWEATTTTFGPGVRIAATIFVAAWLAAGAFYTFVILWFVELFVGGWLIKDLWKKGWVVHDEPVAARPPDDTEAPPEGPRFPRPERSLPVEPLRVPTATLAARVLLGVVGLMAILALVYGDTNTRTVVTLAVALVATYAFFRSILKP